MTEKEVLALLKDERFCNYCLKRNNEDIRYWERWLEDHPEDRPGIERQRLLVMLLEQATASGEMEQQYERLKQRIGMPGGAHKGVTRRLNSVIAKWSVAALLILTAGISYYEYRRAHPSLLGQNDNVDAIGPAVNQAYLTLSDGARIDLGTADDGLLATQSGSAVTKYTGGKLVYRSTGGNPVSTVVPGFNTLTTPKGGLYKVVLPDGSLVYLNAASTLKYPATFTNLRERVVELTGEAFFEISHDPGHPFMVKTPGQIITDMGTTFDVSAYPDERQTQTTLISGAVSVGPARPSIRQPAAIELKPGQQASTDKEGIINSARADTSMALAWKNGEFVLRNTDIRTVMREVSRWYNIEVVYGRGVDTSDGLNGKISRTIPLSRVLEKLTSTGFVHFRTEGRKVTVLQ